MAPASSRRSSSSSQPFAATTCSAVAPVTSVGGEAPPPRPPPLRVVAASAAPHSLVAARSGQVARWACRQRGYDGFVEQRFWRRGAAPALLHDRPLWSRTAVLAEGGEEGHMSRSGCGGGHTSSQASLCCWHDPPHLSAEVGSEQLRRIRRLFNGWQRWGGWRRRRREHVAHAAAVDGMGGQG